MAGVTDFSPNKLANTDKQEWKLTARIEGKGFYVDDTYLEQKQDTRDLVRSVMALGTTQALLFH